MLRALPRLPAKDSPVGRFLVACMAIGFISLLASGLAAALTTVRMQEHVAWVNHTYEAQLAIVRVRNLNEQVETRRRGYLLARQPSYLRQYRETSADLDRAMQALATLTADNRAQVANISRLRVLLADIQQWREGTVALVASGRGDDATQMFAHETDAHRMVAIRAEIDRMLAEEHRLLELRDRTLRASVRSFYLVLAAGGAILLLVAIVSFVTVRRYTGDLARSRDSLRQLNETLEEQVAERTADLSRANEEIQRFAYIVSHDLRSPLVNVMGFTAELSAATDALGELVDRAEEQAPDLLTEEARLAAREDLPEAIGFIRISTQKMDRLINAILKLSRQGRRTLTSELIDLHAMATAIGESIQHVLDDRGVTLTVQDPLPPLVSDRLAIEQILSNLIENASKYLHPDRAGKIAFSALRERGRILLSVADNGRGIAPADHQRIFDLFRRSGTQDQPGEGIGLAHVRALAYRLGGTIEVASALGEGATFTLNLPDAKSRGQA